MMNRQSSFRHASAQKDYTPNYQLSWLSLAGRRLISYAVATVLIYQPLLLQAADLNADQAAASAMRPSIGAAANGVPLVNIAKPNSSGLSHNKYSNFNVGKKGLILNNANKNFTKTQLGGYIQGNPNLKSSGPASVILNEVTSSNRSALNGYVEVGGKRADVIIANPNGITCNGCGFINTPNATLTTGRPKYEAGALYLDVTGGDVTIDGAGINAKNIDKLSIISKAAKLNADIHAKQLDIITGSNIVNMQSGLIISKGASGTGVSIDSSALGGMYANRIKLVGSDKGVGVNVRGNVASGIGGFSLSADGRVVMNNHRSSGTTSIESRSADIELQGDGYAEQKLRVKAKTKVITDGVNASAEKVEITAAELINSGEIVGGANASGDLLNVGSVDINITGEFNNSGEIKSVDAATLAAGKLDNSGLISSEHGLSILAGNSISNSGDIKAGGSMDIAAIQSNLDIANDGLIAAEHDLKITGNALRNNHALFSGGNMLIHMDDFLSNAVGQKEDSGINSKQNLTIVARNSISNSGEVKAGGSVDISAIGSNLDITNDGLIAAEQNLTITGNTMLNNQTLFSGGNMYITLDDKLRNTAGASENGGINSKQNLTIAARNSISNSGEIKAGESVDISAIGSTLDITNDGMIAAEQNLTITGDTLINSHTLFSGGDMYINMADKLSNATGAGDSSRISSEQDLTIIASNGLSNGGIIKAYRDIDISSAVVNDGLIAALRDFTITGNSLLNNQTLFSGSDMYLYIVDLLHNTEGANIYSGGNLKLAKNSSNDKTKKIWNESGTIEAVGNGEVYAEELVNNRAEFEIETETVSSKTWEIARKLVKIDEDDLITEAISSLNQQGVSYVVTELVEAEVYQPLALGPKTTRFVLPDGSYLLDPDDSAYVIDYTLVDRSGSGQMCNGLRDIYCGTYRVTYRKKEIVDNKVEELLEAKKDAYLALGYTTNGGEWRRLTTNSVYIGGWGVSIGKGAIVDPYYALSLDIAGRKHEEKKRRYTETVTEDRVVKNSVPSEFVVGGDLTIEANTTSNRLGLLAANGNITITGNKLDNTGQELYRFRHKSGKYKYCYDECDDLFHDPDYKWAPLPSTTTSEVIGVAAYSTIQAGGKVTINATEVTNSASDKKEQHAPIGIGASSDVGGDDAEALSSLGNIGDFNYSGSGISFALPNGKFGFFVTNTNPDHPYLIETNPEFANFGNFISSAYMIGKLDWNGDVVQKRLGDAAYENKLIRDQIFAQSGRRFIDGNSSDYNQYLYLMENGIAASKKLNLTPGVVLTQEQINNLTQPIVWLEQRVVDGHQVVVPVVYLVNMDRTDHRGGQIVGNEIEVNTNYLANSGSLHGGEILQVASVGDINNLGGSMRSEGAVKVAANDTFNNISGSVSGETVDIMASRVNIETAVTNKNTTHAPGQTETEAMLHDRASVTSKSGTTIVGLNEVNITGAKIATEQGDTTIASSGDVIVTSAKKHDKHDFNIKGGYNRGEVLTHTGSEIEGDNVKISSGKSILLEGTSVTADEKIDLQAKDNIVIASIQNRKSQDDYLETGGMLGAKNILSTQKNSSIVGSSALKANQVNISSKELTLIGSKIEAESARITAEALTLISDKNSEYESHFSDTSGTLTRTIESKGFLRESAAPSTITAAKILFNQPEQSGEADGQGSQFNEQALRDLQDQLITQLSSEHNLTHEQITAVRATLENREWHDKTTTLSKMGSIIVRVISTVVAPQFSLAFEGASEAVNIAITAAVNSISEQFTSQLLTVALTGDSSNFDLDSLLKGAIQAGVTAGMTFEVNGIIADANLGYLGDKMASTVSNAAINTVVYGGSFEDNIINSAIDQLGATGAGYIGDKLEAGELSNIISHAVLGCALGEAKSGDCGAGAAGAAISATIAPHVKQMVDNGDGTLDAQEKMEIRAISQLATSIVVGLVDKDIDTAFYTATNEVENNYLNHAEAARKYELWDKIDECRSNGSCTQSTLDEYLAEFRALNALDKENNERLNAACGRGNSQSSAGGDCLYELSRLKKALDSYTAAGKAAYAAGVMAETLEVVGKYGQLKGQLMRGPVYDAVSEMPGDVVENIAGIVAISGIAVSAAMGDEQAIQQMKEIKDQFLEFMKDPGRAIEADIAAEFARADEIEKAGTPEALDEAMKIRAKVIIGGYISVGATATEIANLAHLSLKGVANSVNKNSISRAMAYKELRMLPPLKGRTVSEIESMLVQRGYTSVAADSGGTVWTKAIPDGYTAAVRIDPAVVRPDPKGWADEVPHAHREIVPTAKVRNGNYMPDNNVTRLDDACCSTTNTADAHIPVQSDVTKSVRYGPTNPGPLDDAVTATFRSGSYSATTVSETTTLYRVYGGSAGKLSSYWTRTKPSGALQSQLDLALVPQWGNTAENVVSIKVPRGTTIYEGAAAPQSTGVGQILGGGNQVYIPRVDPKWIQ